MIRELPRPLRPRPLDRQSMPRSSIPTLDIADELGRRDLMGLVAHEYEGQTIPNCGVWVLRRSRPVLRFLDAIWRRDRVPRSQVVGERRVARRARVLARADRSSRSAPVTSCDRAPVFVDSAWNSIAIDTAAQSPRSITTPVESFEYRLEHLTRDRRHRERRDGRASYIPLRPSGKRVARRLSPIRMVGGANPPGIVAAVLEPRRRTPRRRVPACSSTGSGRGARRGRPTTCSRRTRRRTGR